MNQTWLEGRSQLEALIKDARSQGVYEPTRMVLTTQDAQGRPSSRMVLLKLTDEKGIVFYTNSMSRKAEQFLGNPKSAVFFYWRPGMPTFHASGTIEPIESSLSDAYWASRPRLSQIGAWASKQSRILPSRLFFLARIAFYGLLFIARPIPRPPFWGGFRLCPNSAEVCSKPA